MPLRPAYPWCLSCRMRTALTLIVCMILFDSLGFAAPKQHVVAFGKWTLIKWSPDDESKPLDVKVRQLYVDARSKEFTVGPEHDVTERTFAVQRMFRLSNSLPQEAGPAHWRWERGGWLLVDRVSGKVQQVILLEFDPPLSLVNWVSRLRGLLRSLGRWPENLSQSSCNSASGNYC